MVTRCQLNKLVYERNRRVSITMSAMKAGMSRNTARKYLRQADPSEQKQVPHTWRTRPDPLEGIWEQAERMLKEAPELEAKALFEHLRERNGSLEVTPGQLRSFQRRVRQWRIGHGGEKEVYFTQDHRPGEVLAVDWTDANELGVTVAGQKLDHLLFHAVMPYSQWEWAVRCRSESHLSLRSGLKQTIGRLGKVPRELLIDNSSAATHRIGGESKERELNTEFAGLCEHYGIKPRTINVGCPHENGDCESQHGHLKRRIKQHLLLRGSRDFQSEAGYDAFLREVLEKANALRVKEIGEELALMRDYTVPEMPDYEETQVRVSNNSTIRVHKVVYSVPSRFIGSQLRARIYETRIMLLSGREVLAELPRQGGDRGAVIDYRHLIHWLVRKPGAFAQYRWREEMFPGEGYRAAYDRLCRDHYPEKADKHYLEILQVAALEGTAAVGNTLEELLAQPRGVISADEVRAMLETYRDLALQARSRAPLEASLTEYDALLEAELKEAL